MLNQIYLTQFLKPFCNGRWVICPFRHINCVVAPWKLYLLLDMILLSDPLLTRLILSGLSYIENSSMLLPL